VFEEIGFAHAGGNDGDRNSDDRYIKINQIA